MKIKTEIILTVSKFLALLGGIWYSILCGSQLLTLIASFINPDWAKRTYEADLNIFNIREHSIWFYVYAMCLTVAVSALKVFIWYVVFKLLSKLKLQTPFSMEVEKKFEQIVYLMLGVWIVSSIFWKLYIYYLSQTTGIQLPTNYIGDEYLFIAGIIYIISQVFKRGIEIQEENDLTV
jgi:ABC-type multidrug transport system fused ATPase/permease subunit